MKVIDAYLCIYASINLRPSLFQIIACRLFRHFRGREDTCPALQSQRHNKYDREHHCDGISDVNHEYITLITSDVKNVYICNGC